MLVAGATFLLIAAVLDGDWVRVAPYLAQVTAFGAGAWRSRGEDGRRSRSSAAARS